MPLEAYIRRAAANAPLAVRSEMVEAACAELGVSASDFCDLFGRETARLYLEGSLSWADGDAAINMLSGYFFASLAPAARFPEDAFGVFLAFDAGELLHEPENEEMTKAELTLWRERTDSRRP